MDPKSPGLWLLPTYGRVMTNLPRFFEAAEKTDMSTPGVVVVDRRDYEANRDAYDDLKLRRVMPHNWQICVVEGGGCAVATQQALVKLDLLRDEIKWVGWLADDLVPETMHWDTTCIGALNGWNVVSTNDGAHAPSKLNGSTVWSGDLLRAVGYLFPPGFRHMYLDDLWEEIAKECNNWACLMDVMVRHNNAAWGIKDKTSAHANSFWQEDDRAMQAWRRDGKAKAVDRVFDLLKASGFEISRPDLTGKKVFIAAPCGDGKYESVFMLSLRATEAAVRHFGGETNFCEMKYCSDIALARAKLFSAFLRSDCTHIFWIDSDQGWRTQDFVRVLSADVDFAAVAGIRKVFPYSFGVNVSDEYGNPVPIREDSRNGMLRVTNVGLAFACLTRRACERIVQQHPELEFSGSDGRTDWAVFNPMVLNKRYLGEDFAFCQRWRDLGGEIWVAPEVALDHVGSFVWNGAWLTQLADKAAQEAAA